MPNADYDGSFIKGLKKTFRYDPLTGFVYRKKTGRKIGGMISKKMKYLVVWHENKRIQVHKIAWALTYGGLPEPPAEIDHINGNRQDNRISNLRIVIHQMNTLIANKPRINNKTGYRGVNFCKQTGRYAATIVVHGKQYWLGRHDTIEQAAGARRDAELKLGIVLE